MRPELDCGVPAVDATGEVHGVHVALWASVEDYSRFEVMVLEAMAWRISFNVCMSLKVTLRWRGECLPSFFVSKTTLQLIVFVCVNLNTFELALPSRVGGGFMRTVNS